MSGGCESTLFVKCVSENQQGSAVAAAPREPLPSSRSPLPQISLIHGNCLEYFFFPADSSYFKIYVSACNT